MVAPASILGVQNSQKVINSNHFVHHIALFLDVTQVGGAGAGGQTNMLLLISGTTTEEVAENMFFFRGALLETKVKNSIKFSRHEKWQFKKKAEKLDSKSERQSS